MKSFREYFVLVLFSTEPQKTMQTKTNKIYNDNDNNNNNNNNTKK